MERATSSDLSVCCYYVQSQSLFLSRTTKFNRKFEILNESRKVYPGGFLEVDKNQPFYQFSLSKIPEIKPGEKVVVDVEMRLRSGITLREIPKFFQITVDDKKVKLEENIFDWVGEIQNISHQEVSYLNILMFGLAGSAKSSFINSVFTLLHNSLVELLNPARAGGADGHVTTAIGRYQFEKFRLYDLWGLTKNNYQGSELEFILDGKLPSNWDMKNTNSIPEELLQKGAQTAHERRIHCVLFFVPQASLSDPNLSPVRNLVKQNYEFISKRANMNPLLILSRVDEVCLGLREDSSKTYPELESLKTKASQMLNIPTNRIYYNLNYMNESKKTFNIDLINSNILEAALKSARTYVDVHVKPEEVW